MLSVCDVTTAWLCYGRLLAFVQQKYSRLSSFAEWRIAVFLFPEQSVLPTSVHRIVGPSVIPGRACVDARINTQETVRPSVITYQDHTRYEKYFDGTCHNFWTCFPNDVVISTQRNFSADGQGNKQYCNRATFWCVKTGSVPIT